MRWITDVAFHVAFPVGKPLAPIFLYLKPVPLGIVLDHRAHGAIIDHNATREQVCDVFTETVVSTNKMWEGFRIDIPWLHIIKFGLGGIHCLGADGSNLLVGQVRVKICCIQDVISSGLRRWKLEEVAQWLVWVPLHRKKTTFAEVRVVRFYSSF